MRYFPAPSRRRAFAKDSGRIGRRWGSGPCTFLGRDRPCLFACAEQIMYDSTIRPSIQYPPPLGGALPATLIILVRRSTGQGR